MLFRNNTGEIYNTLGVICNTSGVFSITPKETFVVRCELIKEANLGSKYGISGFSFGNMENFL